VTDAFIEVKASTLEEAFQKAGEATVEITLETASVEEKEEKTLRVTGEDLRYLLFNWVEKVVFLLITEGFAIHRFKIIIKKNKQYELTATVFGEPLNLQKHNFRVEIKAPTFHLMEIIERKEIVMRFLLDL